MHQIRHISYTTANKALPGRFERGRGRISTGANVTKAFMARPLDAECNFLSVREDNAGVITFHDTMA